MTLFAGRPAAGKSTAARWFAAQVSRGTLPGAWVGQPHSVAYIAAEESAKYSVKPSLRAAGADTSRVFFPETVIESTGHETVRYNYTTTCPLTLWSDSPTRYARTTSAWSSSTP